MRTLFANSDTIRISQRQQACRHHETILSHSISEDSDSADHHKGGFREMDGPAEILRSSQQTSPGIRSLVLGGRLTEATHGDLPSLIN